MSGLNVFGNSVGFSRVGLSGGLSGAKIGIDWRSDDVRRGACGCFLEVPGLW